MGKIKFIRKIYKHKTKKVYDIEVEDNHNYFANDLLVSNSANNSIYFLLNLNR